MFYIAALYDTNKCLSMVLKEKKQTFVRSLLLFTRTCPVTKFAVASHLNTANFCCHHVFCRPGHFRTFTRLIGCLTGRCRRRCRHRTLSRISTAAQEQHPHKRQPCHPKCHFLVTVHAYVPSNGICRGFAFKYGKFLLPPRFLTALSVPKVPTRVQ